MYSDHSLCSPKTCSIVRARELVQGIQQSVWLDESGGVLIPRTVSVEVLDDPSSVKRDPVSAAQLEHETRSRLGGDLEKGTTGQKLFRYESENQSPPPLYSCDGDVDLQLGSRYVYLG